MIFDGPGENEDFGAEQTTFDPALATRFVITAPLRNLAVAPRFFHNGAFPTIGRAIRHHLDPAGSARRFSRVKNDVSSDLTKGPVEPVITAGIDPELVNPPVLTMRQRNQLRAFVRRALLDERVLDFCSLVPDRVPSAIPVATFEGCE